MPGFSIGQLGPYSSADTPRVFWLGTPVGTASALAIAPDGTVTGPTAMTELTAGIWYFDVSPFASGNWIVNVFDDDDPSGTGVPYQFVWGGSYDAVVYSAIGLNIAPFFVPFLSTEKPSITYYAGQSPGGDVLVTITDPTGAPVVTAANMTQVGGTDRWDYVLNTAFAVTGLYKVQCLINGDTSSYRTSSFVWASATDPSFGSYQALATTTTATQTLAQALYAKEYNRLYVDTNTNTMTLYDVDNTTPLFVWALLPSATNILDRVPD